MGEVSKYQQVKDELAISDPLYPHEITPSKYRHLLPNPRPHRYSDTQKELVYQYIDEQIAVYGMSIESLCNESLTPAKSTFYEWMDKSESLSNRYGRALRKRTDFWAEQIIAIADENNLDTVIDKYGKIQIIGESVQRSRLMIDSRKWLMSKLNPTKYGDNATLAVTGANGGSIKSEHIDYSLLSDENLKAILNATKKPTDNGGSSDSI
jgi:hypothetical protein